MRWRGQSTHPWKACCGCPLSAEDTAAKIGVLFQWKWWDFRETVAKWQHDGATAIMGSGVG